MVKCSFGFWHLPTCATLTYFTLINIIIYLDRGAIAGVLPHIKDDLGLSTIEAGILGSIFMLGYMISSPFMAHYAQFVHPMFLMFIGLSVWSVATFCCGITNNYSALLVFRGFTGVGEASFVSLGPPHIIRIAPKKWASLCLAIFYSAIFIGTAGGYIYSATLESSLGSWHWPFTIESLLMIPFLILVLVVYKDPEMVTRKRPQDKEETGENQGETEEKQGEGKGETTTFTDQLKQLLKNPVYMNLVLGYGGYAFTLGGLAY